MNTESLRTRLPMREVLAALGRKFRVARFFLRRGTRIGVQPVRNLLFIARLNARRIYIQRRSRPHRSRIKLRSLSDLQVAFISLESRSDRRKQLLPELSRVGLAHATHFVAVERENGALGCAESHSEVLSQSEGTDSLLMVCEDDIQFLCDELRLLGLLRSFVSDPTLDVLQLDIRPRFGLLPYDSTFLLSNSSNSTGCYVVKPHAIEALERYFNSSVIKLRKGHSERRAAVDVVWQKAQQWRLFFATPVDRIVIHKSGHSDIVGRYVKLDT